MVLHTCERCDYKSAVAKNFKWHVRIKHSSFESSRAGDSDQESQFSDLVVPGKKHSYLSDSEDDRPVIKRTRSVEKVAAIVDRSESEDEDESDVKLKRLTKQIARKGRHTKLSEKCISHLLELLEFAKEHNKKISIIHLLSELDVGVFDKDFESHFESSAETKFHTPLTKSAILGNWNYLKLVEKGLFMLDISVFKNVLWKIDPKFKYSALGFRRKFWERIRERGLSWLVINFKGRTGIKKCLSVLYFSRPLLSCVKRCLFAVLVRRILSVCLL